MPQNQEYQLKKPPVQCEHCGRWFKHNGYYIMHNNSIISCVTKMRIAENDKKELARIKEITSNREPGYYRKRWYDKNRDRILQQKKEWYAENREQSLKRQKELRDARKNNVAIN